MTMRHARTATLNGHLQIRCPLCKKSQPLVLMQEGEQEPEDDYPPGKHSGPYVMEEHGILRPDFVCMQQVRGRYCRFHGKVSIDRKSK